MGQNGGRILEQETARGEKADGPLTRRRDRIAYDFHKRSSRFPYLRIPHKSAPIAQLDRVPDFESVGCKFESCWAHS